MRKILFAIIIVLLGVGAYFLLMEGLAVAGFEVNGVKAIQTLGTNLDDKIAEATELTTVSFNNANKELKNALTELQATRKNYESKVAMSTDEEVKKASTKEKHEIQFLYAKIGNYATANGLKLTLDFKVSISGMQGEKDIDFTLEGAYQGITKFLYNIEDDEDLGFRVENFKIVPITVAKNDGDQVSNVSTLQAKFTVRGINVDLG